MKKVAISEITDKMHSVLRTKGYAEADIPFIINMYLGGELRGHTSHGLASFVVFAQNEPKTHEEPVILKDTHALLAIDVKGASGNVIGRRAADEAIKRAKQEGVGIAIIKSMDSWLRPGAIAEYVADQDLVAIVINSGRGSAIAPPGGYDPVTGTNPIAYGIPAEAGSLVVDMATSKQAWGQVRLANKYGTDLPANTFYDNEGNVTVDPEKAWSVMPFGEYKGFSLALMIEVLCGSLVGMPMMIQSTAKNSFGGQHPNTNAMIIVIDPAHTTGLAEFKQSNSELVSKIKATRARQGEKVRIPGEQAANNKSSHLKQNFIEIPDEVWEEIVALN
jgi:L-2-hydroxycarboxylate dehydrogenase (NAD+)